ncbi:MAG: NCS2 family permease [Bacilli bacterium]|nr:NCS2 family permease [Bacilli bacterium]
MADDIVATNPTPEEPAPSGPKSKFGQWLDRYFRISASGSSISRELIGGLVTFLAMFYILPLNSNILTGFAPSGVSFLLYGDVYIAASDLYAGIFVATAVSAAVTTIAMGIFGKLPVGLASGLGINSMIAGYLITNIQGATGVFNFAQAMCLVLVSGVLFLIISITPLRQIIVRSIPKSLKLAISAGIGFFIAFIGLHNMGIIDFSGTAGIPGIQSITLGNLRDPEVILACIGIGLVFGLSALPKDNKITRWISHFAVIISMVVMGLVCAIFAEAGVTSNIGFSGFYNSSYAYSNLGQFGNVFGRGLTSGWDVFALPQTYAVLFSLLFIDFFDTTGTLVGVEAGAGMINEDGTSKVNDRGAMIVDAAGTVFGAVCGTTTVTSFVESTSGVAAGARTGLASVFTGSLFGLSILIFPVLSMFSTPAVTGLALVYVGVCMFTNLAKLDWGDWTFVGAGFMTTLFMCVAYSISDGIAVGFITYTVMRLFSGKWKLRSKDGEPSDLPVAIISVAFIVLAIILYATKIKWPGASI